jgi:hypothetical protein
MSGPGGHILGGEGVDRGGELVEAGDVLRDERGVDQTLGDHHPQEAGQDRGILARSALEVDVGHPGCLGAAGVDDHELHAPVAGLAEPLGRVVLRYAAPHRDGGVGADEDPGIGLVEGLRTGVPGPVQCPGDALAGLVDGARRESHGRPDGLHEGLGHLVARRVVERERAGVHGDRAGPVGLDELGELRGDVGDGIVDAHRDEPVVGAAHAVQQALGVGVLLGE